MPQWANPSANKHVKKKRRRSSAADDSSGEETSSADEMDMDDEPLRAQPLAKLLRDVEGLMKSANTTHKRRKLRPEVLDIQRMKDISGTQPVSSSVHIARPRTSTKPLRSQQ